MKKTVTVVIPIHQINEKEYELYLGPALNSVLAQNTSDFDVLMVLSKDVNESSLIANVINTFKPKFEENNIMLTSIVADNNLNFCEMVNYAVDQISTEYFMVLEYDDVINHKWLENFEAYHLAYPEVKMFVPLVTQVDANNNLIILQNESAWAMQSVQDYDGKLEVESMSVQDLGFIKFESAHKKMKYSIVGNICETESFKSVGKFKPSHKLHFDYEFLLRYLYKGNQVMVIPRTGVKHSNFRPNSFSATTNDMGIDEKKFWYNLAKKEYMFPHDRKITYS